MRGSEWDRVDICGLRARIHRQLRGLVHDSDDVEDLTQDCLIKAWSKRASFRNESLFSSWVYRVVRNEFVSWLRRRDARSRAHHQWAVRVVSEPDVNPADRVINRISAAELLSGLNVTDRRILELMCYDGRTSAEVGKELGVAASSARCRMHRLRAGAGVGFRRAV